MIDQQTYLGLIAMVVPDLSPGEGPAFEVAGPGIAQELYQRGSLDDMKAKPSEEFQFIDSAKHALEFVSLMVGTFEALRKLYRSYKKPKAAADLEAVWLVELRAAGLSDELAARIVKKFGSDLKATIAIAKTSS